MTFAEKVSMYREKKGFVKMISDVFTEYRPKGACINKIEYRVFQKGTGEAAYFREWIVVTYKGGGYSPLIVTGNSNTANYRAIGQVLDHGNYESIDSFEAMQLPEQGFIELEL